MAIMSHWPSATALSAKRGWLMRLAIEIFMSTTFFVCPARYSIAPKGISSVSWGTRLSCQPPVMSSISTPARAACAAKATASAEPPASSTSVWPDQRSKTV